MSRFTDFMAGQTQSQTMNIDIMVTGPTSVSGGEKVSLDVMVRNNNNTDLKSAELRMEYPEAPPRPGRFENRA